MRVRAGCVFHAYERARHDNRESCDSEPLEGRHMKSKLRLVLVGAAAASMASAMLPANADAGVGSGTLVAAGTFAPGLSSLTAGTPQTYTLNGTGTVHAVDTTTLTPLVGTVSCSLGGNDIIGTAAQGAGGVGGTCNVANVTPPGGESCSLSGSYTRTVVNVTATGTVACTGTVPIDASFIVDCQFAPGSPPPTTTGELVCTYYFQ